MARSATAEEEDPEAFPRAFGQYLLLENFARGGMGEVYLAKIGAIAGLERYCVLKKLRSELTRDREYVTRFIDEARVVVTLNHANICHVFDVGRVGEEYYLAMEYVSGRDVRTIQDRCRTRDKPMHAASALHLVCETLEALDYAHRRNHPLTGEPLNLVHRDVSPQNVLVSYEGEVKLIDFGLAASRLKVERTQPNVVMGKMAYMAPEQARGDPIDARADLFACGVLAYELLAGERFYEGMTANDIWQVAGKGGFIPRKWDTIDRELSKHLSKALHPDAKKRFASCGDFREALASHMHWRFPGTGVRGLRDLMSDVFAEELRREREMLARFGTVTVAGFRTEFEESRSQSVSLARADDEASAKALLVRNEQSSSGGVMPPPSARDVHQDPTRLASTPSARAERTEQKRKPGRSTDENSAEDAPTVVRTDTFQTHEPTQRVQRSRPSSSGGIVEDRTTLAVDRPYDDDVAPNKNRLLIAATAVAAVIIVVAVGYRVLHDPEPQRPVKAVVDDAANGTATNGTAANGTANATNGTATNGTATNGAATNDPANTATNGTATNGTAANGSATNGTATNGTNGTAANGSAPNGTAVSGAGTATSEDGNVVEPDALGLTKLDKGGKGAKKGGKKGDKTDALAEKAAAEKADRAAERAAAEKAAAEKAADKAAADKAAAAAAEKAAAEKAAAEKAKPDAGDRVRAAQEALARCVPCVGQMGGKRITEANVDDVEQCLQKNRCRK